MASSHTAPSSEATSSFFMTESIMGTIQPSGNVHHNLPAATLHQMALEHDKGCATSSTGALIAFSGEKTGRSPSDKRVVVNERSESHIWWGKESPNKPLTPESFNKNREIAQDFIQGSPHIFVQDGFINWDTKVCLQTRIRVRVVCTRAYHALFMHNMMIRPSEEELATFGEPDFTIYNAGALLHTTPLDGISRNSSADAAGECPADPTVQGVSSTTSVAIDVDRGQMVILGTEYAGEMKKGVFSVMHYLMPLDGNLTLHSGCNMGADKDVTLFFGLSGTGKTTLSADPQRPLIGDDEHCWTPDGISNLEGGCYAKCINLSAEREPDIFNAIRAGAVLENVVTDSNGVVDYDNTSITQNTRAAYPVEHISNAKIPCVGPHPKNIILLCCDAFGVLPPVARLTKAQTMYHFVSGYTAKVAGTEMGVTEPEATFSSCFGGAFLMWHPMVYAKMLAEMMEEHGTVAWFVNTGWTGGAYGVGERMSLKNTRAIIEAIHSGELNEAEYTKMPVFDLDVPTSISGVPDQVLQPWNAWEDSAAYDSTLSTLAEHFQGNMQQYMGSDLVSASLAQEIEAGGPALQKQDSFPEPSPVMPPPSCALVAGLSSLDQVDSGKLRA